MPSRSDFEIDRRAEPLTTEAAFVGNDNPGLYVFGRNRHAIVSGGDAVFLQQHLRRGWTGLIIRQKRSVTHGPIRLQQILPRKRNPIEARAGQNIRIQDAELTNYQAVVIEKHWIGDVI